MENQTEKQIHTDLSDYVNSICEILTLENRLLLVGSLQKYDANAQNIFVELKNNDTVPRPQKVGETVKVQFHHSRNKERITVFLGKLFGCDRISWRIQLQEEIMRLETRQNFRQRVQGTAQVKRIWSATLQGSFQPCELVDISLGGICFRSELKYTVKETLFFSSVKLVPHGHTYSFHCIVRRIQPDAKNPKFNLYGCEFRGLEVQEENLLCRDIFTLQSTELNYWKK